MITVSFEKCYVCDKRTQFLAPENLSLLELSFCEYCQTPIRINDVIASIVEYFACDGQKETLVSELSGKKILNASVNGPVHDMLSRLEGYICCEYSQEFTNGSSLTGKGIPQGAICVDLCNIPFPDNHFDLIITEAVFEHLADAQRAFGEIARVLKPDGCHFFSIPLSECLERTRNRKSLPPAYHPSLLTEKPSIVYYEFGRDIINFSKTGSTYTLPVKRHIFYDDDETTDLDIVYHLLPPPDKLEHLLEILKYNPAVFVQIKSPEPEGRTTDLKIGSEKITVNGILRYDYTINPHAECSRDYKILKHIKKGSKILEFGCFTGVLTKYLTEEMNCSVYIVERDKQAFCKALKYAKDGVCGDIMDYEWLSKFKNIKFDYLLFSDVLEHLYEPCTVLKKAGELLADDGSAICSIPNIAHNIILLNLFNNDFKYRELGLLDNTHIRFFAHDNLERFCRDAGFSIVSEDGVLVEFQHSFEYDPAMEINTELAGLLESRKYGNVYQFVLKLKKSAYVLEKNIECQYLIEVKKQHFGDIYLDSGSGFSENEKINCSIPADSFKNGYCNFFYKLDLAENIKNIRFDPVEFKYCVAYDFSLKSDIGEIPYGLYNGVASENMIIFDSFDPQVTISLKNTKRPAWIEISGRFRVDEKPILSPEFYKSLSTVDKPEVKIENQDCIIRNNPPEKKKSFLNIIKTGITRLGSLRPDRINCVKFVKDTVYCIETLEFRNNRIAISGWIFSEKKNIENLIIRISFNQEDSEYEIIPGLRIERQDCYDLFCTKNSLYSGFAEVFETSHTTPADISITYSKNGFSENIFIGKVLPVSIKNKAGKNGDTELSSGQDTEIRDFICSNAFPTNEKHSSLTVNKYLQMLESMEKCNYITTVILTDPDGPNANETAEAIKDKLHKNGGGGITVSYEKPKNKYIFEYYFKDTEIHFEFSSIRTLLMIFSKTRVNEIIVDDITLYRDIPSLLRYLSRIRETSGIQVKFFQNNFLPICPSYKLINSRLEYCGLPEYEVCEKCTAKNRNYGPVNISEWRKTWHNFLLHCDEIAVSSQAAANLLNKYYPGLGNIRLIDFEKYYLPKIEKKIKTNKTMNIGILMDSQDRSAPKTVRQMLDFADDKNADCGIIIFGEHSEKITHPRLRYAGKYTVEMLPKLIYKFDIDLFFIPSISPQPSNKKLEQIMAMNFPLAAFNVGAAKECTDGYDKALIINAADGKAAMQEIITRFADTVTSMTVKTAPKILFITDHTAATTRYRVEHFMEQLSFLGTESDCVCLLDLSNEDNIDLAPYGVVVVYRSCYTELLGKTIENAKELKLPVFFGIDDFIFDFNGIKNALSVKNGYKEGIKPHLDSLHKTMGLCDAYIVSTNVIKKEINSFFPGKEVFVSRNVASSEMMSFSLRAKNSVKRNPEKVTIGYYCGAITHLWDLMLIEDILIQLMDEYPALNISLAGPFEIIEKFKRFGERVNYYSFVDWRKLPARIASFDIVVMPVTQTPFHESISENKWMESSLVGVPVIAQATDELSSIIKHGETGFLCKTDSQWYRTLSMLIKDRELRTDIGEKAHAYVMKNYLTLNTGKEALCFLTDAQK